MKTIVVYDSKRGSTGETAQKLAKALGAGTVALDLGSGASADISGFDAVVLGGPVYMGSWSKRAAKFARDNQRALAGKRFAAFSSGFDLTQGPAILKAALPAELASRAVALASLGGAYVFKRMNSFERFIIKAITKSQEDRSSVDESAIASLAASVKDASR